MANQIEAKNPATGQPLQVADVLRILHWARQYVEDWVSDADDNGSEEEKTKSTRAEALIEAAWPQLRATPLLLEQLKRAAGQDIDNVLSSLDAYAAVLESAAEEADGHAGKVAWVEKFIVPFNPTNPTPVQNWWLRMEHEFAALLVRTVVGPERKMFQHTDGSILFPLQSLQEARDIGRQIAEHGDPAVPLVLRMIRDLTEVPDE